MGRVLAAASFALEPCGLEGAGGGPGGTRLGSEDEPPTLPLEGWYLEGGGAAPLISLSGWRRS